MERKRDVTVIQPFYELERKLYGYTLPEVPKHKGYVKLGDTTQEVEKRVQQQVGTAGLVADLLFTRRAQRLDGTWFRDYDFHDYLRLYDIKSEDLNEYAREWFYFGDDTDRAVRLADKYIALDYAGVQQPEEDIPYVLRKEQERAVQETLAYIASGKEPEEFLWNAKPRFGKTLSTYDLIRRLQPVNVLIVTNRPAIANSWYEDFVKFIAAKEPGMKFVSHVDTLKGKGITNDEFIRYALENQEIAKRIAFLSLQDIKGAKFAGGHHDKLSWVPKQNWDLLVIDEAHEGVDTVLTDKAFDQINRKFTLHLSGTPFRALADQKFRSDQIFNWSYVDEQTAKENWNELQGHNPYERLPTLHLFTYQMSDLVRKKVEAGMTLDEDANVDYAFDLAEFFRTKENGSFEYEKDILQFLDNLSSGKFPFSPNQYLAELNHTFWLLPRVASAKALEKLLNRHPVFKEYKTVLAAGDGVSLQNDEDQMFEGEASDYKGNQDSYARVRDAIQKNDKTITLSVGQLTTGVTIPEWSAVLMLNNIQSPALYFQAAFRAQNPYEFEEEEKLIRKENAYIFDFAPVRTLQLYNDFANNLSGERTGTTQEQHDRIQTLLNFFPVVAEDEDGSMKAIDAKEVMTIPNKLVSREVVRQGFMSNLLFKNVTGIFAPNSRIKEILDRIRPEKDKKFGTKTNIHVTDPQLNEDGEIEIPLHSTKEKKQDIFGAKIWKEKDSIRNTMIHPETKQREREANITESIMSGLDMEAFHEAFDHKTRGERRRVETEVAQAVERAVERAGLSHRNQVEGLQKEYDEITKSIAENVDLPEEMKNEKVEGAAREHEQKLWAAADALVETLEEEVEKILTGEVHQAQVKQEEKKKKYTEDETRDHLRGFSRTIPSFLMAYGDENTTLANFDTHIDPDSFKELTSITMDEFRILRDGYTETDAKGNEVHVEGVFNEIVFDESIQEFNETRQRLANYLDEKQEEDIFDYIPHQKTNQIFTPRAVVNQMLDALEEENPGIFSDKTLRFADLYAKSGLYITEIVKRLNRGLKEEIPDRQERIAWIFNNQVYAAAPTRILYHIVKNFIYGEDYREYADGHLVQVDTAKMAKDGTLATEIMDYFGREGEELKFDVIIGNPPYQDESIGENKRYTPPIYHEFLDESYALADKVLMIHPARFLFNSGRTPASWNKKMLNDQHLKLVYFHPDSNKLFPRTNIEGGIAITYRDITQTYKKIGVFTTHIELESILNKVTKEDFKSLDKIVSGRGIYKLSDKALLEHPEIEAIQSKGHSKDIGTSAFRILKKIVLYDEKPKNRKEYVQIFGLQDKAREKYWIDIEHLEYPESFLKYKVILPKANGSGAISECNSTPLIGKPEIAEPKVGHTETFISIGSFHTDFEANAAYKYVLGKFARAMLGILKITQDNTRSKWKYVPLQDFTPNSDIDWTQSVADIDRQLYKKYGLSREEIDFIESKVQTME